MALKDPVSGEILPGYGIPNEEGDMEEPITIDVEQLRVWLESGRAVEVVDIRPTSDYSAWNIPGSSNVDAYQAVQEMKPGALAGYQSPAGVPVVVVCFTGHTSLAAAQYLRSRGIQAVSLTGGMNDWSLAWNTANVPLPSCTGRIIQVRRTGKGCLSYLVGSEKEALVIDPSVGPRVYLDLAEKNGWRITKVLDTHIHADHLSRALELAKLAGAAYLLPQHDRALFRYHPIIDGEIIQVGAAHVKAIRCPGHTMESMCFLLEEKALFTGDTLFNTSVGRPDLKAGAEETQERAHHLYQTLLSLRALDGSITVLPSHTGKPVAFDGIPISSSLYTVISDNRVFRYSEEEFVDWVTGSIPPTPPHYEEIVRFNEEGRFPDFNPVRLEAGPNHCAI